MEKNEDKNPGFNSGITPLHYGAKHGHLDVCKYIMENIEEKNPRCSVSGLTPLHYAAYNGHLDVCMYIMENTNDKSPRCNLGETPLHSAAYHCYLNVYKYIIENIEDKNPRTNAGYTPIDIAIACDNDQIIVDIMQSYNLESKSKRRKIEK